MNPFIFLNMRKNVVKIQKARAKANSHAKNPARPSDYPHRGTIIARYPNQRNSIEFSMSQPENATLDPQAEQPADKFLLVVTARGPYLVYGRPPLALQFITTDRDGECTSFREGARFATRSEPTALCRCGQSKRKPYCDGSHLHADWDPQLTAPAERLDDGAERIEGGTLTLHDNAAYCVFARFCHPQGDTWTLTEHSDDAEARREAIRQASLCPGGRLTAYDRATQRPFEFHFEPSLGLIEDPAVAASGGLWLRGGIPIRTEEGVAYETRNRTVLCRCGRSANKPYCDGSHVAVKWRDGLAEQAETPAAQTEPVAAEVQ